MGGVMSAFPALPLSGGTITGNLGVNGNITDAGTLTVSGTSTLAAVNATNIAASGTLSATGTATLAAATVTSLTSSGTVQVALGQKLVLTGGANARMGTATLVGGAVTVATTAVTANSIVFLTDQTNSLTNIGILSVTAISPGVKFTVASANALDTSTFGWLILDTA